MILQPENPHQTVDPLKIDDLDDSELDEQPFGVICIDREGTILRYNLAEARLARLDRTTVIGRGFFDEVAPCTDTLAFRGRFERFAAGEGPAVQSFSYVFDFKFGAQRVRIEMVRIAELDRFYLLVNREAFEPARPDAEAPAPRQEELQPAGEDYGALRDARGQRQVHAPTVLLDALMQTCQRIAPETWRVFCREWGIAWGRRTVLELQLDSIENQGAALDDMTMEVAAARIHDELREQGWGALQVDFGPAKNGALRLTMDGSALASAARSTGKRCHLLSGMLTAYFTHLAGRRLHAEEIACTAEGGAHCEFALVDEARSKELLEALRSTSETSGLWRALGVEVTT